ncbi:hypothetical protein IPC509_18510 [Pseudomonas aeruginosa]|nr:hypothetical protein IPC509_18510 [Pseudomonas aeruginosa]
MAYFFLCPLVLGGYSMMPRRAFMNSDSAKRGELARKARSVLGASTAEAAQLVHVSKRTWELWESGQREMPEASWELFVYKITHGITPTDERELLVVVDDNQAPLDVVSSDTFLNLREQGQGEYEISSMAVSRVTGRQYIHRTHFKLKPYNEHVLKFAERHRQWG